MKLASYFLSSIFIKLSRMMTAAVLYLFLGIGALHAQSNISTTAEYVLVTEFETGRILMEKQKQAPMKPASMAKIMTSYVVFSRIKDGSLALDDQIVVSEKAWKMGGSRSFLKPGTRYSIKELLYGVIVQSGNDVNSQPAQHAGLHLLSQRRLRWCAAGIQNGCFPGREDS